MRNKLFYFIISAVASVLCFSGCSQTSSSESKPDKRVIEENSSYAKTASQTTVTTLTPLQTFAGITPIDNAHTSALQEKTTSGTDIKHQYTEKTSADENSWFENNKLFELELHDNESPEHIQTWYRFPGNEKTTTTTTAVSSTKAPAAEQSLPPMSTRDPMDFVPIE